ncbi:MAG: 50S ribosomal protein L23 [Anaerolineae bacterium]|nr:50S ribosomal protein L23 [Anaerolineae bacterium]
MALFINNVFEVATTATKAMIRDAVETLFDVEVVKVNVINVTPKRTRRAKSRRVSIRNKGYKKAIVTLAADDTIDLFEGVK